MGFENLEAASDINLTESDFKRLALNTLTGLWEKEPLMGSRVD